MRKTILWIVVAVLAIGGGLAYLVGPLKSLRKTQIDPAQEQRDLAEVQRLLDEQKGIEALELIQKYDFRISSKSPEGKKWLNLLIDASVQVSNPSQLLVLYQFFPEEFDNREKASLLIAKSFLTGKQAQSYDDIRKKWAGKGQEEDIWLGLDADRLMLDGKQQQAIDLLKSKKFAGKPEANRLVRLALISITDNASKSWEYFSQAMQQDPQNPYIRLYRARMLEAAGKMPLALSEYIGAYQVDTDNLLLLDQIGNFFVRYGQYDNALEVWASRLTPPTSDPFWVKAFFWNKVLSPIKFKWDENTPPPGSLQLYAEYLTSLKAEEYWNEEAFNHLTDNSQYLIAQQSAFWLRLIDHLQNGHEDKALELMKFNPFKATSWNPELETALYRILNYRKTGSLVVAPSKTEENPALAHKDEALPPWKSDFFEQLAKLADQEQHSKDGLQIPPALQALLKSDEVFAAAFVHTGWREAAIHLHRVDVLPSDFPEWVAYGYTQALRVNQGAQAALAFAAKQTQTPALEMLKGELMITSGKAPEGIEILKPLASENNEIGNRASWLLSLGYLEQKDIENAKKAVEGQPKLAGSTEGKEMMAKIALVEGKSDAALAIYESIEGSSDEAKSYLARIAYEKKDWKRAKELTQALLMQYPVNPLLRDNMRKILEQEQKQAK